MLKRKEKELKLGRNEGSNVFPYTIFFVILVILYFCFLGYPIQDTFSGFAQENQTANTLDLDDLEEKIFHQKFNTEPKEQRLSRLEEFLFGIASKNESNEARINKITNAFKVEEGNKKQEAIKGEAVKPSATPLKKEEESKIVYDESFNVGIVGAIGKIEMKLFNKIFNDLPFDQRVAILEENLLTKSEITKMRDKPLMERVTLLVKKTDVTVNNNEGAENKKDKSTIKTYIVDPKTSFLIDPNTNEIAKDTFGNRIHVIIPQQPTLQPFGNYQPGVNPYLQNQHNQLPLLPGQLPPLDLFNQLSPDEP